jgi:hypothetical protein
MHSRVQDHVRRHANHPLIVGTTIERASSEAPAPDYLHPEQMQIALTGRYLNHETVEAIGRLHRTL